MGTHSQMKVETPKRVFPTVWSMYKVNLPCVFCMGLL